MGLISGLYVQSKLVKKHPEPSMTHAVKRLPDHVSRLESGSSRTEEQRPHDSYSCDHGKE